MTTLHWRRLDGVGLERLTIRPEGDGWSVRGAVVTLTEGGVALAHRWWLDGDWRVIAVALHRLDDDRRLTLERSPGGWSVDGVARPDLDGAEEPDLSLTPFCNSRVRR